MPARVAAHASDLTDFGVAPTGGQIIKPRNACRNARLQAVSGDDLEDRGRLLLAQQHLFLLAQPAANNAAASIKITEKLRTDTLIAMPELLTIVVTGS